MMLRSIQGLHAPLKLQLERSLASQVRFSNYIRYNSTFTKPQTLHVVTNF